MWRNTVDFIYEVFVPVFLCVLVLAIILVAGGFFVAWLTKLDCANLMDVTGRKTTFRWIGGCYVEHEGEMLPYDKWKLLEVRIKERN